jgi:hypothetical protein
MKIVKPPKTQYFWYAIFALCFIAFQLVQDKVRPAYTGENLTIKYLLGIAPNFFPAIGIPALFFVLIPIVNKKNSANKWLNEKRHITANLISQTGLLSWEFLQKITRNGHFDWNDIIWTLIGALIFQIIWMITPIRHKVSYVEKR